MATDEPSAPGQRADCRRSDAKASWFYRRHDVSLTHTWSFGPAAGLPGLYLLLAKNI